MRSSPLLLYSELLRNLRQVSVWIELPTPATSATKVILDTSGWSISLHHESTQDQKWDISLPLPAAVVLPPNQPPPIIPLGVKDWSRSFLLLPEKATISSFEEQDNHVPWCAPELSSRTPGFRCLSCGTEFLKPGVITTWKDMPSHNWAEVMDFWHCHKPHEKGDTEKDKAAKKRTAKEGGRGIGGFVAQEGVGLVDMAFFLVNGRDCQGLKMGEIKNVRSIAKGEGGTVLRQRRNLNCASCGVPLGFREDAGDEEDWDATSSDDTVKSEQQTDVTLRLNKWNLCIQEEETSSKEAYSAEYFLSAQLIAIINDQAIRRFRLISEVDEEKISDASIGLRIWVFHNDRVYTHASPEKVITSSRGMKVYYIEGGPPSTEQGGSLVEEEDIVVSAEAMKAAVEALRGSNEILPVGLREFRGWRAGNLGRFGGGRKGG